MGDFGIKYVLIMLMMHTTIFTLLNYLYQYAHSTKMFIDQTFPHFLHFICNNFPIFSSLIPSINNTKFDAK